MSRLAKHKNDSSYGSEMGISPSTFDAMNQRRSVTQFKSKRNSDLPKHGTTMVVLKDRLNADAPVDSNRSNGQFQSMLAKKRSKRGVKMVRVEQLFESDVKMAAAYGGTAEPRVRMVPKRFQSTHRNRSNEGESPESRNYSQR